MVYNPLFELYFKHQKVVHDVLLQWIMIIITYIVDTYFFYVLHYNIALLGLPIFIGGYSIAYYVIRAKGKQKLFGSFANYSIHSCIFFASFAWLAYLFLIRIPKFSR